MNIDTYHTNLSKRTFFVLSQTLVLVLFLLILISTPIHAQSPFRLRADSCARALLNIKNYAMPPQSGKDIMDNSYDYLESYEVLAAQISTYRSTTASDIQSINQRIQKLIAVQKDMNKLYRPYDNMASPWQNWNSMWYTGYMMTALKFLQAHIQKYNITDGTTINLAKDYENGVKTFMSNINFDIPVKSSTTVTTFSNLNFPSLFSRYLAIEMWPNQLDRENRPLHIFKSITKARILLLLDNRFHEGFTEGDATTYSRLQAEPLKMLAEYAQDPELKAKARATFQAYMVSLSHDYNNGLAVICPDRSKGLEMSPNGNNVARMAWLFLGAARNNFNEGQKQRVSGLLMLPGELEPDARLQAIHNSKEGVAYESTEYVNGEIERKYISKNYTIAASTGEKGNMWGQMEAKNNMIGWQGINWLTFCIETDGNRRSKDGDNKYSRQYLHKKTIVGVFNIPAPDDHYKPFLPFNYAADTASGKYLYQFEGNWLFCHTGTMLYAVGIFGTTGKMPQLSTTHPKMFGGFSRYFILDERKGGWIIETAELSEDAYKGKSKADQLAAFKNQIMTKTNGQNRWSLATDSPALTYESLTGDKIWLDYTKGRKLNDQTPTNLFPTDIFNSPYFQQKKGSDTIYVGAPKDPNRFTIIWPGNSSPSVGYNYTDTYMLPAGKTSVTAGKITALATDPDGDRIDLTVAFKNGPSLKYTSPYTPYYVEPGEINRDTSIVFTWKDKRGAITRDTLMLFVVKRPQAAFNRNLRNQYLPTEKPSFELKGKDIPQKIMDLEVLYDATPTDNETTLSRLSYMFLNTRPDSMILKETLPLTKGVTRYLLRGKARSWKAESMSSTDTLTIHIRNIVIQSPTPNLVLYRKNKTFTTTGAMVIPTGATAVGVQVLVYENGVVVQTLTATVSGSTYTVTALLPSSLTAADKVQLVARMSYTLNGSQNETSYPVEVKIDDAPANTVSLSIKAFLQGAMLTTPNKVGYSSLMRDDLRTKKLIPTTDPYRGRTGYTHVANPTTQTITNANVMTVTGDNAIVDWVFVELREKTNAIKVVATQSALIQRDGDVVSTDGLSPLAFDVPADDYYVALRHRNHLSVMAKNPTPLSSASVASVDFTNPATQTQETNAQVVLSATANALWAGDTNGDGTVVSAGTNTDVNFVSEQILRDKSNPKFSVSFILQGYSNADIDLDGTASVISTQSDLFLITNNILRHPANKAFSSSFVINKTK